MQSVADKQLFVFVKERQCRNTERKTERHKNI